ncbi:hypothetical protein EKO27_g531 [Xylaria grammica]|uniref:Uncharacterized protein n=1 Tax=Xylaria grammica TaxID=363999 RepID=A0A439DJI4_9PEZI|nr:hypothetical protein EKO27_g531 [Xylaria grammica]
MANKAISTYSFASCGWNTLQAVPLIIGPQAVLTFLTPAEYPQTTNLAVSDAGQYLARSLGLALLALGFVTVVLSGGVPVGPSVDGKLLPILSFPPSPSSLPKLTQTRRRPIPIRSPRSPANNPVSWRERLLRLGAIHIDGADGVSFGIRWKRRSRLLRHVVSPVRRGEGTH